MTKLASLLVAVSLCLSGCHNGAPAAEPSPVSTDNPSQISNTAPDEPTAGAAIDPAPTGIVDHKSGLIKLAALKTIATGTATYSAVSGYPGSGFHFGVFSDGQSYTAFATAAGLGSFQNIDWDSQMVVFAILDAQTNDLSFMSWTDNGHGDATLRFDWIGIEPHYTDATPAVLALVSKSSVKTIHYASKGTQPLGSYRLP